jgi:hypothetical protein
MRTLKITLGFIVVTAIGAAVFFWIQSINEPDTEKSPENQFTKKIEQEIEQIKTKPDTMFCSDFYREVKYHINDFYKQKRFGNNQSENDQWKENLENILYAVYTEKFVKQANTVFRGSEWDPDDLRLIQAEKNELQRSILPDAGSSVDNDFTTIQAALNKYNEIVQFIASCSSFVYSNTDLTTARFPITEVQSKISRAESLLSNNLENDFVSNCTRLHRGLEEIPKRLFEKHISYLEGKIDIWSEVYSNYNSHIDYSNNLNRPIRAEIEALDNGIYNVNGFDNELNRLLQMWSSDNARAYSFDYNNK